MNNGNNFVKLIFLAACWLTLYASTGLAFNCDVYNDDTFTSSDSRRCMQQITHDRIKKSNKAPKILINRPEEDVCYGETVTLDGSGSWDEEGSPLSFKWTLLTKPKDSAAELSDTATDTTTFVTDAKGTYQAKLVISDGTHSRSQSVTIYARGPRADAGKNQLTVKVGETVKLNGKSSAACSNNTLTYSWKLITPNESKAELSNPKAVTPSFIADIAGHYDAVLTVNDGIDSKPNPLTIITSDDNVSLKYGDVVDGAIDEPGEIDVYTFTGQQDEIIALTMDAYLGRENANAIIYLPSGEKIDEVNFDDRTSRQYTLPETGTYVICIKTAEPNKTGNYSFGIECIHPAVKTETELNCGDVYAGEIKKSVQVDIVTFAGQKDEVVTLSIDSDSVAYATVFQPPGKTVETLSTDPRPDPEDQMPDSEETFTLPETGTYVIKIWLQYDYAGEYHLGLECNPADNAGSKLN